MKSILVVTALSLFAALLTPGQSRAAELYDVTLPDTVSVGEETLALNGMGLRKKAFIKVYVAGLYLTEASTDPAAILASDSSRRITMVFKFGVSAEKMCNAWDDGLENNPPAPTADLRAKFETLCSFMDDLESGDVLQATYVPGQGTEIEVKGSSKGTIPGKDFADGLFACWLGPEPPGEDLKRGLLAG